MDSTEIVLRSLSSARKPGVENGCKKSRLPMFHSWADNLCNHCVYICTTLASQLASTTFTKSNKENHFISKRLKVPPHTFFVLACYIEESGQKRNQTWFLFNLTPSKELYMIHIKVYPSRNQRSPCKIIFYVSDYVCGFFQ